MCRAPPPQPQPRNSTLPALPRTSPRSIQRSRPDRKARCPQPTRNPSPGTSLFNLNTGAAPQRGGSRLSMTIRQTLYEPAEIWSAILVNFTNPGTSPTTERNTVNTTGPFFFPGKNVILRNISHVLANNGNFKAVKATRHRRRTGITRHRLTHTVIGRRVTSVKPNLTGIINGLTGRRRHRKFVNLMLRNRRDVTVNIITRRTTRRRRHPVDQIVHPLMSLL